MSINDGVRCERFVSVYDIKFMNYFLWNDFSTMTRELRSVDVVTNYLQINKNYTIYSNVNLKKKCINTN